GRARSDERTGTLGHADAHDVIASGTQLRATCAQRDARTDVAAAVSMQRSRGIELRPLDVVARAAPYGHEQLTGWLVEALNRRSELRHIRCPRAHEQGVAPSGDSVAIIEERLQDRNDLFGRPVLQLDGLERLRCASRCSHTPKHRAHERDGDQLDLPWPQRKAT